MLCVWHCFMCASCVCLDLWKAVAEYGDRLTRGTDKARCDCRSVNSLHDLRFSKLFSSCVCWCELTVFGFRQFTLLNIPTRMLRENSIQVKQVNTVFAYCVGVLCVFVVSQ